ncbi:MAG: hypothetical protein ACT4ON_00365 [Bacteroidota bacterium]
MSFIKQNLSILSPRKYSAVLVLFITGWFIIMPLTKNWQNPLSWDIFGYYLYTPAIIIWQDPGIKDFSQVENINSKYQNTPSYYQGYKTDQNFWMIKYTIGLAVLEFPFFFIADTIAPALGYEDDGFSKPYQTAMVFSHFFYLILGFIFLRKALLKFFTDKITALLLLLILIGTNYYINAITSPASIHTLEFTLFSIVLYLTIIWHESPTKLKSLFLGLTIGLVTIVRPTDGLIAFIPLLWNVISIKTFKEKLVIVLTQHKIHLVLAIVSFVIVVFPQLYYWKKISGSWFVNSYNNPGEGFEFFSPYILQVLFSFRKGWFVYTPIMVFAVIGFWQLYKKQRNIFLAIFIFSVLNIYLVSSWSCWWYAMCYGQRAMVDSYSILILPLGYFISNLNYITSKIIKGGTIVLITFFVALNIFQSWQYMDGMLDGSRMTSAFYFRIFGKTTPVTEEDRKLLLVDRSYHDGNEQFKNEYEYSKRILFFDDFETIEESRKKQYTDSIVKSGNYAMRLDSNSIFTPKNEAAFNAITRKDHVWVRTTFWYYMTTKPEDNLLSLVITFVNTIGKAYKYSATDVGMRQQDSVKLGQWNKFTFDYLSPEVRNENDKINVYFWLRGKTTAFVDDFKVEVFEKKE